MREALRDWQLKRERHHDEVNRLRQAWDEGIASGTAREIDFEAVRAEGRRRLAAIKAVMTVRLFWTPQSEEDLLEIYVGLGIDSPSAADRIYNRLRDTALLLLDNPKLGPARPEISKSARTLIQSPY